MSHLRRLVLLLGAAALLAGCGSSNPAADTRPAAERVLPGKGPAGCNCKPDEVCLEIFDGLCHASTSCVKLPAGCQTPCGCGGGDAGPTFCQHMNCCAGSSGASCFEPCRFAEPDKKYYTCSGA